MSSSLKEMRKAISAHNTKGHYKMGRAQLEDVVLRKMLSPPKMTKKVPKKKKTPKPAKALEKKAPISVELRRSKRDRKPTKK